MAQEREKQEFTRAHARYISYKSLVFAVFSKYELVSKRVNVLSHDHLETGDSSFSITDRMSLNENYFLFFFNLQISPQAFNANMLSEKYKPRGRQIFTLFLDTMEECSRTRIMC